MREYFHAKSPVTGSGLHAYNNSNGTLWNVLNAGSTSVSGMDSNSAACCLDGVVYFSGFNSSSGQLCFVHTTLPTVPLGKLAVLDR